MMSLVYAFTSLSKWQSYRVWFWSAGGSDSGHHHGVLVAFGRECTCGKAHPAAAVHPSARPGCAALGSCQVASAGHRWGVCHSCGQQGFLAMGSIPPLGCRWDTSVELQHLTSTVLCHSKWRQCCHLFPLHLLCMCEAGYRHLDVQGLASMCKLPVVTLLMPTDVMDS